MFAPVIPFINDAEMETVLEQAAAAGAKAAGYVILRLPNEVKQLFREWLKTHDPGKTEHVFSIIRDLRSGRRTILNISHACAAGVLRRSGPNRFRNACRKFGLNNERGELTTALFKPPVSADRQQSLF